MSVSFPQMAFWVIFPLAALIVLSGWTMILISAVKKLRSRRSTAANGSPNQPADNDPLPPVPEWPDVERILIDGTPAVPLP